MRPDGRLRPDIHTLGARTGRWTVGGALPVQQLPTVGGFRECLVADPGRALIAYDYRSIEFVTLAAHTRDPGMLAVVRDGRDPFLAPAEVIWPGTAGLGPDDPERARRRKQSKQFVHGLGYGMGPQTLAARSGLPLPEATRARPPSHSMAGAHREMREIRRTYWRGQRALVSPFGRRYRIPTRNGIPVEHQALNNVNQGTARDLMMRDLVALVDAGLDPWLTVHDEIIVQCDTGDAQEADALMRQTMSRDRHPVLSVPVRVEGGVLGRHWRKL